MRQNFTHNNYLIFLIVILSGCKDNQESICPNPAHYHYKLEDVYKSRVPYQKNDTILYSDTTGKMITLILQKIDSGEITINQIGNPSCEPSTEGHQYYNYMFKELDNRIIFEIGCYKGINIPYYNIFGPDQLRIQFNEYEFFDGLQFIGVKSGPRYIPILKEGNKTFYDLNRIFLNPNDTNSCVYYNKTQGVVQIKIGSEKYNLQN